MDSILIKNLEFKWPNASESLLSIKDLKVKQNSSLFLQGESGSGKSTLLSLLAGINKPQSGSIELLGENITEYSEKKRDEFRADHIGYIFQMFNLLPYLNVIDNVTLPCFFSNQRAAKVGNSEKEFKTEAKRLLQKLGLSTSEILSKRPTELSFGQQQRVAACRALIGSPEILIADEPTSALDANAQMDFLNLITDECQKNNITLIFVSHDERLASNFDRITKLEKGSLKFMNTKLSI